MVRDGCRARHSKVRQSRKRCLGLSMRSRCAGSARRFVGEYRPLSIRHTVVQLILEVEQRRAFANRSSRRSIHDDRRKKAASPFPRRIVDERDRIVSEARRDFRAPSMEVGIKGAGHARSSRDESGERVVTRGRIECTGLTFHDAPAHGHGH